MNQLLRLAVIGCITSSATTLADEKPHKGHVVDVFKRQQLSDVYFSEGASAGDLNGDGILDVVYGPHWYAGPTFEIKREIYPAVPQNRKGYANNFFSWVHDFDGDGHNDVLTVGFPGKPGYVYRNPGKDALDNLWERFEVADSVSNESPQFLDVTGDGVAELICTRRGHYGFYMPRDGDPFGKWTFNTISPDVAPKPFGHGLGIGDVNNDKHFDIIARDGWFEQPRVYELDDEWIFHKFPFAPGGADMFAYDVDGDGDNDVITSLSAHNYGLAWYESQPGENGVPMFRQHLIMGSKKSDSPYGVLFTEPHAVKLADINGDGLQDIVTGKTYWSHHTQSPMWDAGAVVYWFELHRQKSSEGKTIVDFVPRKADGESGIGRGLFVGDVNGDKLPDIVTGGMKGAHVLIHSRRKVSHEEYERHQPTKRPPMAEGLKPEAAAAQMTVPPGFKVQLAAGEPMVHQPIAMCFDHKGRLWVAEGHTYPRRADQGEGKDRIVIFEDTTGDGLFDNSKTFIEGLNLVSGLEVGFGGVYVGAAPYLMFIPDRDGDDKPDVPGAPAGDGVERRDSVIDAAAAKGADVRTITASMWNRQQSVVKFPKDVPTGATVLRDGFGWHDTHETLNGFIWGPDGWLYGCHGVFTHSKVGKPGTPDDKRQGLNCGVWRYHPTNDIFEVFASGTSNPWGVDFNDQGQCFITACVIPHLWHMVQGARYHRQGGRHFNAHTYDDIKTIADHAHYVGNIRDHAWWGHEPKVGGGTADAGGGHAHAGAMIYLGNSWPKSYRNQIFFNNVHGNRINTDLLEKTAGESGYVGHHGNDFLFANDHYYRGINLRYGPDGSVYIIDWYDKNACHRTNPEIWDRSNGRIYRVSYQSLKTSDPAVSTYRVNIPLAGQWVPYQVKVPYTKAANSGHKEPEAATEADSDANDAPAEQNYTVDTKRPQPVWPPVRNLLAALEHPNEWFSRMARKRLMHLHSTGSRLTEEQIEQLEAASVDKQKPADRRLRNLWTLGALGALTATHADKLLNDNDEYIRAWTIQLMLEDHKLTSSELQRLEKLAVRDDSAVVRLYLASALQRLPIEQRWELSTALSQHAEDVDDHNIPLLLWYGIEPLVPADPARAMKLALSAKIPLLRQYIVRRASAEDNTIAPVVATLTSAAAANVRLEILNEMLSAFEGRVGIPMPKTWGHAYDELAKNDQQEIRDRADQLAILFGDQRVFPRMRNVLANADNDVSRRRQALEVLVRGQDNASAALLLQPSILHHEQLQGPAVRALATIGNDDVPSALLSAYTKFSPATRTDMISTLVSRPNWSRDLLGAIGRKSVPAGDLHAYHVRQILSFKDRQLETLLTKHWGKVSESSADRKQQIAAWKKQLTPEALKTAHTGNGRRVYAKTCQKCHKLFGVGGDIGPDITGSNRANLDYILENVLDPSSVVGRNYQMTVVALESGRVVSGLLKKETDSALTIQTINDKVVIPKSEIEDRSLSIVSMMPERQLDTLPKQDARDLIAYLASPIQVTLSGPPVPIDQRTGKVPHAFEAENLKIVEKTAGKARSQPMGGFTKGRWSGKDQIWWTGAKPGSRLAFEFTADADGTYVVETALTMARDYGIVKLSIDETVIDPALDLFNSPDVISTGALTYPGVTLKKGNHRFNIEITGANPRAAKSYMVGIDYLRLLPPAE